MHDIKPKQSRNISACEVVTQHLLFLRLLHCTDAADVCCMRAAIAHILRHKHWACRLPHITSRFSVLLCGNTGDKKTISNGEVACFASALHWHICKIQRYSWVGTYSSMKLDLATHLVSGPGRWYESHTIPLIVSRSRLSWSSLNRSRSQLHSHLPPLFYEAISATFQQHDYQPK
jgi:hypothetical protein